MRKPFFLCTVILSSMHISFAMEDTLNRITQTVYDKLDPTIIISELNKNGTSKDPREKMTQMHRLDRTIPFYMEKNDPANLCTTLNQIMASKWPLSPLAQKMAKDYLWKIRPSIVKNKPLLENVNSTLDSLDPAQVIHDLQNGQVYSDEKIDLENRVNRALNQFLKSKNKPDLEKLLTILIDRKENQPEKAIVPGERILTEIGLYLKTEEKKIKLYKDMFGKAFKLTDYELDKKSDS